MNPTEVLTRMINGFASSWDVTEERLQAIFSVGGAASQQVQPVLLGMIVTAKTEKTWEVTPERIVAVRSALLGAARPTSAGLKKIAAQVRAGAAADGVQDKPWVDAAVRALETMASVSA